jgi:hypothetical protein
MRVMPAARARGTLAPMTDQDPAAEDPAAQQPSAPAGEPPADPPTGGSRGWVIAAGVLVVLLLGVLTALVIDRGDAGAAANTAPAADVDLHRTTSTTNVTTTVTAPPATTVTVTPTVTIQAPPARTTTTPTVTLPAPAAATSTAATP